MSTAFDCHIVLVIEWNASHPVLRWDEIIGVKCKKILYQIPIRDILVRHILLPSLNQAYITMLCTRKLQESKAHNSPALIKELFRHQSTFFCLKCDDELGWRNFRVFNHTLAHLPFRHPWFHATNFSIFHFLLEPKINITYTHHGCYMSRLFVNYIRFSLLVIDCRACTCQDKKILQTARFQSLPTFWYDRPS